VSSGVVIVVAITVANFIPSGNYNILCHLERTPQDIVCSVTLFGTYDNNFCHVLNSGHFYNPIERILHNCPHYKLIIYSLLPSFSPVSLRVPYSFPTLSYQFPKAKGREKSNKNARSGAKLSLPSSSPLPLDPL
jgi:hypothetical protein